MDCENYIDKSVKKRQALSNSNSSGSAVTSFSPSNQLTPTSSATNSSSSTPVATPQPSGFSRKSSVPPGSSSTRYSIPPIINTDFDGEQLPAQIPTGSSFTSSIDEDFSMIINSEEHSVTSSPSPVTANTSARDSPEENAEECRPITQKRSSKESTVVGNKPTRTAATSKDKRARQTSMKTRSGGKQPSTSYANVGKVTSEKRKPNIKGKGKSAVAPKSRRQRNTNKLAYIQSLSQTIRRESDETVDPDPDEPKTRQPDENDYIRTAIVSSADNQYVCNAPMCLICGSIGKDIEGTMLSCMSCAQSYHSYCVSMHDKLNKTILKRGWRCLQCTVCEACGDGSDESNLLLCDECDVAFHTYCLEPKLDKIPTGSWRCHWCATCRRCNKQVQAGLDLHGLEGLCESCHSLRKCPKCKKLYETGDLMIRCQHCSKWYHGPCEELTTEEQLENAYENAFRCSMCRPKANADYNDGMNQSVIIDNVMVNKSALEMLKCGRSASSLGNLADITGSFRSQSMDQGDPEEAIMDDIDLSTAGRGRGRITGPGRRPPKIGIGGFIVKNRNRITHSIDDEPQEEIEDKITGNKSQKRRPRKPRRHQLEDAYPAVIQLAFWGVAGVDGKTVVEMDLEEPTLEEFPNLQPVKKGKEIYELSDQATEALRNEQNDDVFGNLIGENLENFDVDVEDFDFNLFFGDDDDELDFANEDTQDSYEDASQLEMTSNSTHSSAIQERLRVEQHRQLMSRGINNEAERANQASEKWQEDEPLGDKATKAAVLHANVMHPDLKINFPNWNDRVKQIHRLWRGLHVNQRQEYVQKARENRAHRPRCTRQRRTAKPETGVKKEEGSSFLRSDQPGPSTSASLSIESLHEQKPSASQLTQIKQEGVQNQQSNGIHPASNSDIRIAHNGMLSHHMQQPQQQIVKQHSSQMNKEQMSLTHVQQQPGASGIIQQQMNILQGTPSTSHQNGIAIKTTNGPVMNRPLVTPEIAQKYDMLKKKHDGIKQQQSFVENEVIALRKLKKNLAAKKRSLNKNAPLNAEGQPIVQNLTEDDQRKWDDIHQRLGEKSKEGDKLKKASKDFNIQLEKLESEYGIVSVTAVMSNVPVTCNNPNSVTTMAGMRHAQETNGPLMVHTPHSAPGMNTSGLKSPNNRFNFNRSVSIPASSGYSTPNAMLNNGDPLQRADSVASISSEPGNRAALDNISPPKGSRGRKRKTKVENNRSFRRSVKLGNISFSQMKDDVDRQVYDTLDAILHRLTTPEEPNTGTDLRRLLMTHAPIDEASSSYDSEIPKKKKRTTNKKSGPTNDGNEFDSVVERIQNTLATLPNIPPSALNPLPSFDPALLVTEDNTKLPDNNEDAPLDETKFGVVTLSFMDDFYDDFEEHCQVKYKKQNLPLTCSKFYANIIREPLEDLWAKAEQEFEDVYGEFDAEPSRRLDLRNEVPWNAFEELLRTNGIKDRAGVEPVISVIGRWPDCDSPPVDPPRSRYYWREMNYPIELDLVLDHDEDFQTSDIITQLANILNGHGSENIEEIPYEIGAAHILSPASDSYPDIGDDTQLLCCICRIPVDGEIYKTEVHEPFEQNEHYCCPQCYELRNIPNENWSGVKASEPVAKSPLSIKIEEEEEAELSLPSPDNEEPCLNEYEQAIIIDALRQAREQEYTVTELPQPIKPSVEVTPGGSRAYKYRGQGWLVCDDNLLSSFIHPHEDTQEAIRRHCNNWKNSAPEDTRHCTFCGEIGDGKPAYTGRLLNVDANEWVHVNCAIWSVEVHESECGGLNNVQAAIKQARSTKCSICNYSGASLKCIKLECEKWYHLYCAVNTECVFMKDTTMACKDHCNNIHSEVRVTHLEALRRIYVEREENALLARIYNNSFSSDMMMRVGNLVFYAIGQLLPEQIKSFHDANFIYPVGYKVVRFFWHPGHLHERIGYECVIENKDNVPVFRVTFDEYDLRDSTPQFAWNRILNRIQTLRDRQKDVLRFFPSQVPGENLFGLNEIAISKMMESLPGVDLCKSYEYKHGGVPLMDVPLAINPTGCARTEPCFRTLIKARKTYFASPQKMEDRPGSSNSTAANNGRRKRRRPANNLTDIYDPNTLKVLNFCGISEDMIASGNANLNSQAQIYTRYKTMKNEWRSYVALGRSGIAGFGLYAKKDINMNQMVTEYVGEIIRSEVCEIREKKYAQKNKGIYMFRIDSEFVIDATMCGNMARYINHSCDPNCVTQIVNIDNTKKIVIFANRPIRAGEELTYDYQFELEDTKDKIPCLCGAPNCVKWMN
uniref:Histone-lysine N-methyltransferase n=1 Tax=Panagrolaimus sp. ES5 TaxID=591445 RepID=A0AC34GVX6_9BILA